MLSPIALYWAFQHALFYRELVILLSLVSIIIMLRRYVVSTSGALTYR